MDSSKAEFSVPEEKETLSGFLVDRFTALNITLLAIVCIFAYKIIKKFTTIPVETGFEELPKIRKDMTVAELRQFDGNQPDGRVLVAVNGWIFDVTRGRRFYGPGERIN